MMNVIRELQEIYQEFHKGQGAKSDSDEMISEVIFDI